MLQKLLVTSFVLVLFLLSSCYGADPDAIDYYEGKSGIGSVELDYCDYNECDTFVEPDENFPEPYSGLDSSSSPSEECNIKGNISFNTGEKIYHVPGQEYYSVTVISEEDGERWFCSENEAKANGWRKSYK